MESMKSGGGSGSKLDPSRKWEVDTKGRVDVKKSKGFHPLDRLRGASSNLVKVISAMVNEQQNWEISDFESAKTLVDRADGVDQKLTAYSAKTGTIRKWIDGLRHGNVLSKRNQVADQTHSKLKALFYQRSVFLVKDMEKNAPEGGSALDGVAEMEKREQHAVRRTYDILTSAEPTHDNFGELDSYILSSASMAADAAEKDDNQVLDAWYEKMADKGFPAAQLRVAQRCEEAIEEMQKSLDKLEDKEGVDADKLNQGIEKLSQKAVAQYHLAAAGGVLPAKVRLMKVYQEGQLGVDPAPHIAHRLAAGAQKDDSAFLEVCVNLKTGLGVPVYHEKQTLSAQRREDLKAESWGKDFVPYDVTAPQIEDLDANVVPQDREAAFRGFRELVENSSSEEVRGQAAMHLAEMYRENNDFPSSAEYFLIALSTRQVTADAVVEALAGNDDSIPWGRAVLGSLVEDDSWHMSPDDAYIFSGIFRARGDVEVADRLLAQALDGGKEGIEGEVIARAREKFPDRFLEDQLEPSEYVTQEQINSYDLAVMYEEGIFVKKSPLRVQDLIDKAAAIKGGFRAGIPSAKFRVGTQNLFVDNELALAAFEQAAERRHVGASFEAAEMLVEKGGNDNLAKARTYYSRAASGGYRKEQALNAQGRIAEKQGSMDSARAFYKRAVKEGNSSQAAARLLELVQEGAIDADKVGDDILQRSMELAGTGFIKDLDIGSLHAEQAQTLLANLGSWTRENPLGFDLDEAIDSEMDVDGTTVGAAYYGLDPDYRATVDQLVAVAKAAYPDDPTGVGAMGALVQGLFGGDATARQTGIAEALLEGPVEPTPPWIPSDPELAVRWVVVEKAMEVLRAKIQDDPVAMEGVFRLAGGEKEMQAIDDCINDAAYGSDGPQVVLGAQVADLKNIHSVATAMKRVLRKLANTDGSKALVPVDSYTKAVEFGLKIANKEATDSQALILESRKFIAGIPEDNREMLGQIMLFLHRDVLPHKEETKMAASNLAIVFQPSLMVPPEDRGAAQLTDMTPLNALCTFLIEHAPEVFE